RQRPAQPPAPGPPARRDPRRRPAELPGLAARLGWYESKVSRIVNAVTLPSAADIEAWCTVCDAAEEIPALLAALRNVEAMFTEWRRLMRGGLARVQAGLLPLYEAHTRFRAYSSSTIPGMLQTAGYAEAVLRTFQQREGLRDDVAAAVAARLSRQELLRDAGRQFAFVIEEHALRTAVADAETMSVQLGHLLTAVGMPNVSVGIAPMTTGRAHWPMEDFWLLGDSVVKVEMTSGELSVTEPAEVQAYAAMFARLADQAVNGAAARRLIAAALESLD
ncbi:DUF5753 domain-containing protein, partial [Catenulispora yoronensis]